MRTSELAVYKDIHSFSIFIEKVIMNVRKDYKVTYGRFIKEAINELVKNIYLANIITDFNRRMEFTELCLGNIETIKYNLRILYIFKQLGETKTSEIERRVGEIARQLWGWREYFMKNIPAVDESEFEEPKTITLNNSLKSKMKGDKTFQSSLLDAIVG